MFTILLNTTLKSDQNFRIRWQKTRGNDLDYLKWTFIFTHGTTFTVSLSLQENLLEMIHRWHLAHLRLAKIYKAETSKC